MHDRTQYKFINGLRAIAALIVVYTHSVVSVASFFLHGNPVPISVLMQQASHYAVVCFLVVSGFCLGQGYKGARDAWLPYHIFMLRRSVRMLIPYAVAYALSVVLALTVLSTPADNIWNNSLPISQFSLMLHALMLHDGSTQTLFSGSYPLWTIAVEWRIYFLAPIMAIWLATSGLPKATIYTVLLTALACAAVIIPHANGNTWITDNICGISPQFILVFFFGFATAHLAPHQTTEQSLTDKQWMLCRVALFVAAAIYFLGDFLVNQSLHEAFMVLDIAVGLAFAVLIYICATAPNILTRQLETRPLVMIGTISYSLYLVHAPVLELVRRMMGVPVEVQISQQGYMFIALAIAVCIAVATAFYFVIEKPCHDAARRIGAER